MLRLWSITALLLAGFSSAVPRMLQKSQGSLKAAVEAIQAEAAAVESSALSLAHVVHHNNPFDKDSVFLATHPALAASNLSKAAHSVLSTHSLSLRLKFKQQQKPLGRRDPSSSSSSSASSSSSLPILAPDVTDRETVFTLATMSDDAYYKIPALVSQDSDTTTSTKATKPNSFSVAASGSNEEVMDWMEPSDSWGRNSSFGWDSDGLRGYVWVSTDAELVVIAFKGTDIFGNSSTKDRVADLLMFSCCCGHVDYSIISQVCKCASHSGSSKHQCSASCIVETANDPNSYLTLGMAIYDRVRQLYPRSQIWVTGHSLGGSMANLVSRVQTAKDLAHKTGSESSYRPTFSVSFNAPAERLFASRVNLADSSVSYGDIHQWQFGTEADPIFMGRCNGITSSCYYVGIPIETMCRGTVGASHQCVWNKRKGESFDVLAHRISSVLARIGGPEDLPSCEPVDDTCADCDDWAFA